MARILSRVFVVVILWATALLGLSVPAFAQVDLTGVWNPNTADEDNPERIAGPSLVEFVGLPINDQARVWGLSYRPSRLSLAGAVPSYFAGENPDVAQYAAEHNLPLEVTLGGAETTYPEYRARAKSLPVAVFDPAAAELC